MSEHTAPLSGTVALTLTGTSSPFVLTTPQEAAVTVTILPLKPLSEGTPRLWGGRQGFIYVF